MLAALVANALPDADRASIAVHAASCEHCHALIEDLLDSRAYDETLDSSKRGPAVSVGEGSRIGRYVIGERLGAGGMGVVYAAVDSELQRRVAVKLLRPDGGQDQLGTEGRERLMREARMLARLSHPNVVTVFDVGTHQDALFLAMELVEGGNLSTWLRRAPRSTREIVERLIEAGRGLAAAHAAGVVHRDVKPDNILVGRDGRARMTDFGLARIDALAHGDPQGPFSLSGSPDLTRTGTLMGTPVYMAPEQMAGGETDPRTDQWSFCAMIYEVVAGVRPFAVLDLDQRSSEIVQGKLAPPAPGRRVPAWLRRIVVRGLRANPDERWPAMDVVIDSLVRGLRRRGRIIAGAAIGAGLAITSLVVVVLAGGRSNATPSIPSSYVARWPDTRPGCVCPYSPCDGGCAGECNAPDYIEDVPLPGVNVEGQQHALLGASSDGDAILYLSGKRCALDRLFLARRRGATYEPVDLTDKLDTKRIRLFEGCCTLAPDGQSMILPRPDLLGFVRVRLAGSDPLPPDDDQELAGLLVPPTTGLSVRHPVLAADGLTLYYKLVDRSRGEDDFGPLDGSYASVRRDLHAPFPPGSRLRGRARYYEYISGVSSDGLSLFMSHDFVTHVLVRASTDQPFSDPWPGVLPARLPGWRAAPVEHCKRIITTHTPGGCPSEKIVWLKAKR